MAPKERYPDNARTERPIVRLLLTIKDKLLLPFRILTSKFALRAYITSILFFTTAFVLFLFAVAAYVLFYWSYIPRIGFSREVYLQYDPIPLECRSYLTQLSFYAPAPPATFPFQSQTAQQQAQNNGELSTLLAAKCGGTPSPWGTAPIVPDVISQQAYDVLIELVMPRTPLNTETGPFTVDARLLSQSGTSTNSNNAADSLPRYINAYDPYSSPPQPDQQQQQSQPQTLAHARRPALLPYTSPLLSLLTASLSLPRYMLGLQTDTTTLRVPLFTGVSFPRGRRAVQQPGRIHVQLQSPLGRQVAVYRATVEFRARFAGLRWVMYNFRVPAGVVFVVLFWCAEVGAAVAVYAVLGLFFFGGGGGRGQEGGDAGGERVKGEDDSDGGVGAGGRQGGGAGGIKREDEDGTETDRFLSDAERVFPSYGGQVPLRYPGGNGRGGAAVKREGAGEGSSAGAFGGLTTMTPGPGGEADDEDDEDADFVLDDPTGRWRDSGMGTSMESGRERDTIRRRRSRPSSREGGLR